MRVEYRDRPRGKSVERTPPIKEADELAEINRKLEEENVRLRDIIDEGRPTTENNIFGQEKGPIAEYMEQTLDENRRLRFRCLAETRTKSEPAGNVERRNL